MRCDPSCHWRPGPGLITVLTIYWWNASAINWYFSVKSGRQPRKTTLAVARPDAVNSVIGPMSGRREAERSPRPAEAFSSFLIVVAASTLLAVSEGLPLAYGGGVVLLMFRGGVGKEGGGRLKLGGGRLKSGT